MVAHAPASTQRLANYLDRLGREVTRRQQLSELTGFTPPSKLKKR
jgi:hypothetical protein